MVVASAVRLASLLRFGSSVSVLLDLFLGSRLSICALFLPWCFRVSVVRCSTCSAGLWVRNACSLHWMGFCHQGFSSPPTCFLHQCSP